ncbi:hypothetical protein [Arthrobacter mobilis]|uniref:Uncharacterized protein n=1 Tax=Arthrobacter mobilis TaxID=2724944 RepID=A0A7X6HFD6_9MICC|nr:hypothetical protein [Arthrobacter mobilis]NKX55350.1 hypothetical protein [Arthrobacter mobilis]
MPDSIATPAAPTIYSVIALMRTNYDAHARLTAAACWPLPAPSTGT